MTGIVLEEPLPLGKLAAMLVEAHLQPVEYMHERSATQVNGGFVGDGLPLAEQIDEYRAAYRSGGASDDPSVVALVVKGSYAKNDLGPLAAHVAQVARLPSG
jgi:hypothetical protein